MKTPDNKYNVSKVESVYEYVKSKLNNHELSWLTDKLALDKHVMIKTAQLIQMDYEQQVLGLADQSN